MTQEYRELLIGCGNKRIKLFNDREWKNLTTLDSDQACRPDLLTDLNVLPYALGDNEFDEIHAYEVLEHCGKQGDYKFFFKQFSEFWRILKPEGILYATVPYWSSVAALGDPGHTRIINVGTLTFLSQKQYSEQVGNTQMTDYREIYNADFEVILSEETNSQFIFALQAKKGCTNGSNEGS